MGSGYKNFTAGAVLTASDVNNYLMEQGVMYFANTTARDTALSASLEDGMTVYIGSNDANEGLYTYNGTAWRKGPGWNAPWGYIQYTEVTSNVTSGNNVIILTGNTISVVNNRRYRITGHVPGYFSSAANNVANVSIRVGGTDIAGSRVFTSQITSAENGCNIVAMYVATATNASLACNLFSTAVVGTNHQYLAAATTPMSLLVEDIGPSGAPA